MLPRKEKNKLYKTAWWKRIRATVLEWHPLCKGCLAKGKTTPATEVDHILPHRGEKALFYVNLEGLQSLCSHCHGIKSRDENPPPDKTKAIWF